MRSGQERQVRAISAADDVDASRAYLRLEEIEPAAKPDPPNPDATAEPSRRTESRIADARRLIAEQRYTEAIAELEKALRYDPTYGATYRLLGVACRRSGAMGRASAFLNKAVVYEPTSLSAHYHLAKVYAQSGDKEQALHHLRVAWACPDSGEDPVVRPLVALELARLLQDQGYLSAALGPYAHFEQARATWSGQDITDPDELDFAGTGAEAAAVQIGRLNERLGRLDAAHAAYERAARYAPDDFAVEAGRARLLMRMGRDEEARGLTRRLMEVADDDEEWEEVRALYELGAGSGAFRDDLRVVAEGPEPSVRVLNALFEESRRDGDLEEAERVLVRLIAKDPDGKGSIYRRAVDFYQSEGRGSGAATVLARALAERPHQIDAIAEAADTIGSNSESARVILDSSAGLLGDQSLDAAGRQALQYILARIALVSGAEKAAKGLLESLIAEPEGFAAAYVLLGELDLRQAKWEQAVADIEAGFRRDEGLSQNADAHWVLARAYEGLDDVERATEHYELAIAGRRDDPRAVYALGQLLERRGESLRGRRMYQDLLTLRPGHEGAHEALVRNYLQHREVRLARDQLTQMEQAVGTTRAFQRCQALWDYANEWSSGRRPRRQVLQEYVDRLEALLGQEPDDVRTGLDLAAVLIEPLREYGRAGRLLDRILAIDPYNDQAVDLRVQAHQKLLGFEPAVALVERQLTRYPGREAWKRQLAQLYLVLQEYVKSAAVLEELHAKAPTDAEQVQLGLYLLNLLVLADRTDAAIEQVRRWEAGGGPPLESRELSPDVWRDRLIRDLIAVGESEQALELAEEWYERSPEEAGARAALMNCLMALWNQAPVDESSAGGGRPADRAALLALEWLEDDPDNADLNQWMISLELLQGRTRAAVELASNLVAGVERDDRLQGWLAQVLMEAGRQEEAVRIFRNLARNSGELEDYRRAAAAMINARQFEQAERYLLNLQDRLRAGMPHSADVLYLLYICYLSWDKSAVAEEQLARLVEDLEAYSYESDRGVDERYFGCCNDLGYVWANEGRNLARAEELIRWAVAYSPRRAAYLDSLGWVLYKRGDLDGALTWLERAVRAQRSEAMENIRAAGVASWVVQTRRSGGYQDAVLHQHLGDALWALGRRDEAAEKWREAAVFIERRAAGEELTPDEERTRGDLAERLTALAEGREPAIAEHGVTESGGEGE